MDSMAVQYFALKTGGGGGGCSFKIILNQVHFIARFQNHYLGAFFLLFVPLFLCVCVWGGGGGGGQHVYFVCFVHQRR